MQLLPVGTSKILRYTCSTLILYLPSTAPKLSLLVASVPPASLRALLAATAPLSVADGSFVGMSTCDGFTSALGSGQRVLSYSYYTPWKTDNNKYIKHPFVLQLKLCICQ